MSASLVAALTAVVSKLSPRDAAFAASLLDSASKRPLSPKQEYWAEVLINRATAPAPEPVERVTVNVSGIIKLFAEASANLKRPKVRLSTEDGQKLVLARAGTKSKYTGDIMMTDGGPFGANKYFGRISAQTGEVFEGRDMTPEVRALMLMFAADPAGVGSLIGKRTGQCCFCSRELSTKESLAVGYGPVCAEQYGLPW